MSWNGPAHDLGPVEPAAAPPAGIAPEAAPVPPRLTAEVGTTAPLDGEWQALMDGVTPHARFATAAWFRAWGASFLPYQDWRPPLRYVSVRGESGELLACVPLASQRKAGVPVDSLAGFYWPFRTPVIPESAGPEVFDAVADALTRCRRTLALRCGPVPETDAGIAGLNAALERRGWRIHRWLLGESCAVDLPETWEQFEPRLGKKLRSNTKYYERKMQREGTLAIQCMKGVTGEAWAKTVRDLASIEGKSWQQKAGGKARFHGEPNRTFWTSLLAESDFGGMASAWVMHFNGEPVSFCFCVDCGGTRHIIANHYAEHVRDYGTGSILYRYVFRDAVESGTIRRVDIGLGDPGYKSRWGAQPSFRLLDWMAFRPGTCGRVLELATRLR